jgi:proteasome lid subunit RPN8/RPN11
VGGIAVIYIDECLIDEIRKKGEASYPNECCGIILGSLLENDSVKYAKGLYEIVNSSNAAEQHHRFLISAEDMMKVELYARKNGLEIVGFYHSHPDCEAVPSEYDRSHALPVYSYIITSVVNGEAVDAKSWELTAEGENNKFYGEKIFVKENI